MQALVAVAGDLGDRRAAAVPGTAGGGSSATWSCANTLASRQPVRGLRLGIGAGVAPRLQLRVCWVGRAPRSGSRGCL